MGALVSAQLGIAGANEGEASAIVPAAVVEDQGPGQVRRVVARGREMIRDVLAREAQANRNGDILLVTCLRDKLHALGELQEQAEARLESLDADGQRDAPEAGAMGEQEVPPGGAPMNTHAVVLIIIGERMKQLAEEAVRCLGGDLYSTPELTVLYEVDDSIVPFDDQVGPPDVFVNVPVQDLSPPDSIDIDIDPVTPDEASRAF